MKKILLTTLSAIACCSMLMAGLRPEIEARMAANKFMLEKHANASLLLIPQNQIHSTSTAKHVSTNMLTTPFYIYNNANGGYVIISGSDYLDPVIGYSETGSVGSDMPDGLSYWLEFVANASNYIEEHPETAITAAQLADYGTDISPLLGEIKFNQNSPYNDMCPTGTFTGCMATAMAQVLAHHKYPVQPHGNVSVNYGGRTYSANLDNETYNWANILPTYKGGAGTSAQRAEVAKLHYHVGLSLEMEYGTSASGSVSTRYAKALKDNFGYNANTVLLNRDCYTYGEWVNLLLGELSANRPVIYDGVSGSGGHAFVIDGFRASDGFFHVNWGWEGTSNGYYNIILLDPSETGIGASLSSGFTSYQDAMINVDPDQSVALPHYLPVMGYAANGNLTTTSTSVRLGGTANIGCQYISNMSSQRFSGEYGALIVDAQGNTVSHVRAGNLSASGATMNSNYYLELSGGSWTVPSNLANGDYRVYMYIKEDGYNDYLPVRTNISCPNFLDMNVSDGYAYFSIRNTHPTNLEVVEWGFEKQAINYGDEGLTCTIQNTGNELEYGTFRLSLDIPNSLTKYYYVEFQRLKPGESKNIYFPVLFTEYGEYTIRDFSLSRLNGGGTSEIVEPRSVKFSVLRTLAETINLLNNRLSEAQSILNRSRLSGNYPAEACDKLQSVIDAIRATNTSGMTVADVQALLNQLNAALQEFYQSFIASEVTYWSYIGNEPVNDGWCPANGGTPNYFAMSIPEEELAAFVGGQISGLRCHFGHNNYGWTFSGDDLTCKVFLLDFSNGVPGNRILATSDEFIPTYNDYAVYNFKEPYTIGAGGIMCVAEVTAKAPSTFGAMGASKNVTTEGACWANNGTGWWDIYLSHGSMASAHAIQAVISGGQRVNDVKLTELKATPVSVGENITISGRIQNLGTSDIEEYEVSWTHDDDGLSGTKSVTTHIERQGSTTFSITVPGFETAKLHTVRIAITTVNGKEDAIPENSTFDVPVPVTFRNYIRKVVLEENTGTNCGYCPRGFVTMDYMKAKYGERFIPISIHHYNRPGSDPMFYEGDNLTTLFSFLSGAPTALIDRKGDLYNTLVQSQVEEFFLQESAESCIAELQNTASYDASTGKVTVQTTTEFGYNFNNANYRLAYYVLEDGVGPYTQYNYYAGGSLGTMGGWESKPMSVSMIFNDVMREFLPAYSGEPNSVPSSVSAGQPYSHTYTFTLPSTVVNANNVRIVSILLNPQNNEFLNACECKLNGGGSGIEGIESESSNATDQVFDLSGRRVNSISGKGLYIINGQKTIIR
ncbi:MAG: C10 family peptidase [Bacteroidales bacterium]|nr:C10 family peptidase [Candidatus Liminaster caballi]